VDGSESNGSELEVDALTDRQPVQLPPQLGARWEDGRTMSTPPRIL